MHLPGITGQEFLTDLKGMELIRIFMLLYYPVIKANGRSRKHGSWVLWTTW
jgi:hypothetical protein